MDILDKITKLTEDNHAQLVVVSKTYSTDRILEVYQKGFRIFGENKVQEILEKKDLLPQDIQWHMIGHLQTNKVKFIVGFVDLIHSVDSEKLLSEINKQAQKVNRVVDVLLQVYVAQEETKYGLDQEELSHLVKKIAENQYPFIRCRGVMGMASFTDNKDQVRSEFRRIKSLFDQAKSEIFNQEYFDTISMGMSGDYDIALEEGSTMIRIGSLIFGKRN